MRDSIGLSFQLKSLQRGFSLVEILATVVILSVGLLGVAGLQANALRFNHDGYLRSVAVSQSNAMADRMRANPLGLTGANYTNISGVGTNPSCTTACTGAEIAARDAFEWNTENAAFLPNGQGTVTGAGGVYVITVYWDANRTGATGTACSGDPQVDLTCLRVSTEM